MTGRDFLRVLEGNANYEWREVLAVEPFDYEVGYDVGNDIHRNTRHKGGKWHYGHLLSVAGIGGGNCVSLQYIFNFDKYIFLAKWIRIVYIIFGKWQKVLNGNILGRPPR